MTRFRLCLKMRDSKEVQGHNKLRTNVFVNFSSQKIHEFLTKIVEFRYF